MNATEAQVLLHVRAKLLLKLTDIFPSGRVTISVDDLCDVVISTALTAVSLLADGAGSKS